MAASDFQQIRDLAYRSFGLDLKPGKEELVSARLQKLVRSGGFQSYQAYCRHVLHDRSGESLMALIDALATNHTSFLREADHFDFLRRRVAPVLARRAGVEVWSAACSTGEEIWTLAFVLRDALPTSRIQLLGTDISRKALASARRATYEAARVQVLPKPWLTSYLDADGNPPLSYTVKASIRAQAVFQRLNLIEPLPWNKQFPVIFCRNVMIYFDRATQQRVIASLAANLEPGGYLFVGHAESFSGIDHRLEYVQPAIYRRPVGRKGGLWNE
ncbi:MAG: chemotaxis protein CheR [Terriglobia bacterium]|nr:MAG: chemotaxis protein CheR [Terriglobia bacterium]